MSGWDALVEVLQPKPDPRVASSYVGTVTAVQPIGASQYRVLVSGVADQSVPCDWSSAFALDLVAMGSRLVGEQVLVVVIDGQMHIAYRLIVGVK